jgi:hypothetical protein
MRIVSEAEAIELFRRLMTPFITHPPASALGLFDAFVGFHRDIRVRDTDHSVLLEWGSMTPRLLPAFGDLRVSDFPWDKSDRQWLGLSRQLKSTQQDGGTALRAWAYFGVAVGDEPSSNVESDELDGLDIALARFVREPYVARLLAIKPSRVIAFVGEVG